MKFDDLMAAFARKNDMGELDFRDNKYRLVLDDSVELTCFQANGLCYFHGLLAPLPDNPRDQEELLTQLLKTNLSLVNIQCANLCIEPDNKHLGLYMTRSLQELDEEELENALLDYLNYYEILKQDIDIGSSRLASGPMILMP